MAEEHEYDEEEAKLLARAMKDSALTTQKYLLDQYAGLARWVIASLLAVNSGGLIAILNSDNVSYEGRLWAGSLFGIGLCLAILTGYANMRSVKKVMPGLSYVVGFWTAIGHHGVYSEEAEKELLEKSPKFDGVDTGADVFGWLSFGMFAVGLIFSGTHLKNEAYPKPVKQTVEIVVTDDR